MIRYTLVCDDGHDFESWFQSASSYDAQAERGLVSCPLCGSAKVEKALMAPSIGRRVGSREASPVEAPAAEVPVPVEAPRPMAVLSEREQALRSMLRAMREHVTKTADYVGPGFAEEARRMHYGEIEHRSIYGEADSVETQALREEGIEVHPLPILPDDRN